MNCPKCQQEITDDNPITLDENCQECYEAYVESVMLRYQDSLKEE